MNFWENQGCQMHISELMDYDPYLNRISTTEQ